MNISTKNYATCILDYIKKQTINYNDDFSDISDENQDKRWNCNACTYLNE